MKITDLCMDERPREKMLKKGAEALSNVDLLAIIIRTGSGKNNAMDLARKLIQAANGSLTGISKLTLDDICQIKGIGKSKAISISAALEIGKRYLNEKFSLERKAISDSQTAYDALYPNFKGLDHEECWILLLNQANYIIDKVKISSGGMTATILDTKMIIKKVLDKKATSVILFHNHPSGNPRPGSMDIKQTEKLKKAMSVFNITLWDHIVISENAYYSFADEGITILDHSTNHPHLQVQEQCKNDL